MTNSINLPIKQAGSIVTVPTASELPANAAEGDCRWVEDVNQLYIYRDGSWAAAGGGVQGPISGTSTDNAIARWDGATGLLIQDSNVTVSDAGSITLPALQTVDGRDVSVDGAALDTHLAASTGVHGVAGSVVGTSDSQALTNKTINADLNTITNIDNADIKVGAGIDAAKLGTGVVSTTEFEYLNGVASSVVGISDSQALTNKTIDADLNTLSNIDNADIKTGANIDAAKIGTGAVSTTEFNYLDGVTSAIQTQLGGKQATSEKGIANGYASLDGGGKVPIAQLPSSIMEFQGNWNAATNTPTLVDGTGDTGDVYRVNVAGTQDLGSGPLTFVVGDWAMYNGTIWQLSHAGADAVLSVNSASGVVTVNAINQLTGHVTAGPASGSASAAATIASNVITNSMINSAAGIDATKIGTGTVSNTEFGYLDGVIAGIQDQFNNAQPLDGDLSAIAALSSTGLVTRTGPGTAAARTVTGTTNRIAVTNGDGVLGNPTLDIGTDVVTLIGVQSLTDKTLDNPTIDNSATFLHETTPATPSAGRVRVYPKSDNSLYVLDSTGTETQVGSGSGQGEKNYITNPSAKSALTGWNQVGDLDVTRTTTAAELPREYTTAAGLKIAADANTQSAADYVYFDFTLDDVDLSRKLKIQWSQKLLGAYAAGQLEVVITTQADRTTALHTPATAAIPAADGIITTSFDSSTTATLSLVIRATTDMAVDTGIVISDVIVGPGQIVQGAAIGPQTLFTPVSPTSAFGTFGATYTKMYWRRVGDKMHISGRMEIGTVPGATLATLTIPLGLTAVNHTDYEIIGHWTRNATAVNEHKGGAVMTGSADLTRIYFAREDYAIGTYPTVPENASTIISVGAIMHTDGEWIIPIAEWAGSGTVNLGSNDVEYVYNSGVWNSSDNLTDFAYGPRGGLISGAITGNIVRKVRFQTPIQATDTIQLQFSKDGVQWVTQGGHESMTAPLFYDGTAYVGSSIVITSILNSTDINVTFARYSAAWTNGGNRFDWPATLYWRVVKSKAGATVGFGLASATQAGLVYRDRYQLKLMTEGALGSTVDITSLKFTGLTIGKTYRVTGQAYMNNSAGTVANMSAYFYAKHNGGYLCLTGLYEQWSSAISTGVNTTLALPPRIFVATGTTVTFEFSGTNNTIYGANSITQTWTNLEELNNLGASESIW